MFKITYGKGFHLIFKYVTLSTQIGYGSYCDNYNFIGMNIYDLNNKKDWESKTCEIAIWENKNGKWITKQMEKELFNINDGDDVKGYVNFEDWLKIFEWCKNYKEG